MIRSGVKRELFLCRYVLHLYTAWNAENDAKYWYKQLVDENGESIGEPEFAKTEDIKCWEEKDTIKE